MLSVQKYARRIGKSRALCVSRLTLTAKVAAVSSSLGMVIGLTLAPAGGG